MAIRITDPDTDPQVCLGGGMNCPSASSCSGVWSKRRQTKTAKVKTATGQNGD